MNSQIITITDRTLVSINNIKNVISFNENEFIIESSLGNLKVTGKNLTIGKMDTEKKDLLIKGNIDSINYINQKNNKEEKKESVFAKLFK